MKLKIGLDLSVGGEVLESQKVDFLNRYYRTKDGFVIHNLRDPKQIMIDDSNDYRGQGWQFRIKIEPDQDNLEKAVEALSLALKPYNVEYKLLRHLDQDTLLSWDGAFATKEHGPFDRSQHGKECCVYMSYSTRLGKFQYSPEQYKHIMLDCVKALQDKGVKFGTVLPAQGDSSVPCEAGILPMLSYTAFRPFKGRHTLLQNSHHNPRGFQDPLAGIKITKEDMRNHNININALEAEYNRCLDKQEMHLESAVLSVLDELRSIKTREISTADELLTRVDDLKLEISDYTKQRFLALMPRDPDNAHILFSSENELNRNIELGTLNDHLSTVCENIKQEVEKTLVDFKTNNYVYNFLIANQFISADDQDDKQLRDLIVKDLAMMQVIYVRLVFIAHEQEYLMKDSLKRQRLGLQEISAERFGLTKATEIIVHNGAIQQLQNPEQFSYSLRTFNRSLGSWLLTTGFTTTIQTIVLNRIKKVTGIANGIHKAKSEPWYSFLRTLKKYFLAAYGFDGYDHSTNMITSADGITTEYTGQSLPFWLMFSSFLGLPNRPNGVENGVPIFTLSQLMRNFIGVWNPVKESISDGKHSFYQYRWTEKKIISGLIIFFKITILLAIKIIIIPFKTTLNIGKLVTEFLLPVMSHYLAVFNAAMFNLTTNIAEEIHGFSLKSFSYAIAAVVLAILTIGAGIFQYATVLACRAGLALTSPAKSAWRAFALGRNLIVGKEGSTSQKVISNIIGALGFILSLTMSAVLWSILLPLALGQLILAIPSILTAVSWVSQLPVVAKFLVWFSHLQIVTGPLSSIFGMVSSTLLSVFGPAVTILSNLISVQVPAVVMTLGITIGLILTPIATLISQGASKLSDYWVRWIEQTPFATFNTWLSLQISKEHSKQDSNAQTIHQSNSNIEPMPKKVFVYQPLEGEEYIISTKTLFLVTKLKGQVKKLEAIEVVGEKAEEMYSRASKNINNSATLGVRFANNDESAATDNEPMRYISV